METKKVIISWKVDTGYMDRIPAFKIEISGEEWDDCETEEERNRLIESEIKADFDERIRYFQHGKPDVIQ